MSPFSGDNVRIVVFDDEPKVWWWTDNVALVRGVGAKPKGYVRVPGKLSLANTAKLDVARVCVALWQQCAGRFGTEYIDTVRDHKRTFFGIQEKYQSIVEKWPKPVKWLIPRSEKNRSAAALVLEAESQQIVAVVMPMGRSEDWRSKK